MCRAINESGGDFGAGSTIDQKRVAQLAGMVGASEVLDYGCGRGLLKVWLSILAPTLSVIEYDPGIAGKETPPDKPSPVVACFSVLEHVEPRFLDAAIAHMASLCGAVAYIAVHTGPSHKTLPDGRNMHLTVKPTEWWIERLSQNFTIKKSAHFVNSGDPSLVPYSMFLVDTPVRRR